MVVINVIYKQNKQNAFQKLCEFVKNKHSKFPQYEGKKIIPVSLIIQDGKSILGRVFCDIIDGKPQVTGFLIEEKSRKKEAASILYQEMKAIALEAGCGISLAEDHRL